MSPDPTPDAQPPANPAQPPTAQPAAQIPKETKKKEKRFTGDRIPPARAYAARALMESGFPIETIAREEHISKNTLYAIKKSDRFDPDRVERVKRGLSAHFYVTTERSLEHITEEKLEKASALQLMTVAAIGTDKARLIEGKATARTEYLNAEDKALELEIEQLQNEVGQWQRGEIVNTEGIEGQDATSTGEQAPKTEGKA